MSINHLGSIPNVGGFNSSRLPLTREVPRDEAEGEKKGTKALIKPFFDYPSVTYGDSSPDKGSQK